MRVKMPAGGTPSEDILAQLEAMSAEDIDWRHGRVPAYIFRGGSDDVSEMGRRAYNQYFTENSLGAKRAFPSLRRMEKEIVDIGLGLFHAPEAAAGYLSTGGTESIIMAVKACRDWLRRERSDPAFRGNLVMANTAHPAFTKAARLMDLEVRRTPTQGDFRADPAAIEAAVDGDTMMIVGAAPCYPRGVVDPIQELGEIAERRGIWLHVDACVGGYLAPFVRQLGYPVPEFDFAVPGVRSLSADLHKYGFCPKPASTVFFRDAERAACAMYEIDEWPSGLYAVATVVGTRPGGAVAGAWATLHYLGEEGYRREARRLMTMRDAYRTGIEAIPGFRIIGNPQLTLLSFGTDRGDVRQIAEGLARRGWVPSLTRDPPGLHLMLTMIHETAREDYLRDLAAAAAEAGAAPGSGAPLQAVY